MSPQHLLQDISAAGPYRLAPGQEQELLSAAAHLNWPHLSYRPDADTTASWLAGLGEKLAFPTHFGANFDALYDCLTDTEICNPPGLVLILGNLAPLGEAVDILIAVLQAASDEWRDNGRALWALLDAPRLDLDPLPKV